MGLIFNRQSKEDKDVFDLLYDVDCIVDELMFREDLNQSCYPCYKDVEWNELCDEIIVKITKLKGCDPFGK